MITHPDIEKYFLDLLPPRDEVLAAIEEHAARHNIPIVGPAVGSLLAQLVTLSGARRIFELGSATGYSTIWLARAAGPDAEVHYSDGSRENAERARASFERAGVPERIRIHVGDALAALAATEGEYDFIFNDVDKEGYPEVLDQAVPRLRPGGVLVSDNTLWHSEVLEPRDEAARAIVEFNRKVFARKDLMSCLVPLRDGLTISIRERI